MQDEEQVSVGEHRALSAGGATDPRADCAGEFPSSGEYGWHEIILSRVGAGKRS